MMLCCPQLCGPQTVGPENWWCWLLLISPPAHQKNVHELITPYFYYKTCHYLPQVGTRGLEGISLHPFARQSSKTILFYFTQNSVSEIWFGTSAQRSWAFTIRIRGGTRMGIKFWREKLIINSAGEFGFGGAWFHFWLYQRFPRFSPWVWLWLTELRENIY